MGNSFHQFLMQKSRCKYIRLMRYAICTFYLPMTTHHFYISHCWLCHVLFGQYFFPTFKEREHNIYEGTWMDFIFLIITCWTVRLALWIITINCNRRNNTDTRCTYENFNKSSFWWIIHWLMVYKRETVLPNTSAGCVII